MNGNMKGNMKGKRISDFLRALGQGGRAAHVRNERRNAMDPQTCEIPKGRHLAPHEFPDPAIDVSAGPGAVPQTAVLAGGCFWCVEAVLKEIDGVLDVTSGYAGGTAQTADYQKVCSGRTDHAEVVEVRFDPARVSYGQLLKVFLSVAHDPTQLNRQGADQGRQYRSAIFYADE